MRSRLFAPFFVCSLMISSVGMLAPIVAHAQQRAVDEDHADLLDRVDEVNDEIDRAAENRDITITTASKLKRQLNTIRKSARQVTRQQGFLSAGESSSYNRTLDSIEDQLPNN